MSGQISGMLEPASGSFTMGTLTPEKMADSTNKDLFLFSGELLFKLTNVLPNQSPRIMFKF